MPLGQLSLHPKDASQYMGAALAGPPPPAPHVATCRDIGTTKSTLGLIPLPLKVEQGRWFGLQELRSPL